MGIEIDEISPIGQTVKEPVSVGQEFIEWAEKYWHIDKLINPETTDHFNSETCDYKYMRNIFVDKINSIIKDRIGM